MAAGKEPSFEELYEQLQAHLKRLEEGNLSLDEAIRLFEEGSKLADQCRGLLDAAELRIRKIEASFVERDGLRETAPAYEAVADEDDLPFD